MKESIHWEVTIDLKDSDLIIEVRETKTYDFHGWQPTETRERTNQYSSEADFTEYIAAEFAKVEATLFKRKEPNKSVQTRPTSGPV